MPNFSKSERLCSKVEIDSLISDGKHFTLSPFKVIWKKQEADAGSVKVLITVPKRLFKRAVDRNLLKRRIREAYRLHKIELTGKLSGQRLQFSLIYIAKTQLDSQHIHEAVKMVIDKLNLEIKK